MRTVLELGTPVWTRADTLYGDIRTDVPGADLRRLVDAGVGGIMTDLPGLLLGIVRDY